MQPKLNKPIAAGLLLAALFASGLASPALADVKAGADAWSRGDYAAAIREWEGAAATGDPDAMFNLAQAYRLGRGVPADPVLAESLYAKAAADGHLQAADTYGLMLFERGQREDALPYIRDAARRGDPRAQYLLGIAHFNGDDVERDWQRAYALMLLANAAALPPAAPALAEMDQVIPLEQRQQAARLAEQLLAEAEAARKEDWGAFTLEAPASVQIAVAPGTRAPAPSPAQTTGPEQVAPEVSPPAASGGPWRVQLGAFAVSSNAEALWNRVAGRVELAGAERLMVPEGRVIKLQAGGFPTREAAQTACAALKLAGYDCLATNR